MYRLMQETRAASTRPNPYETRFRIHSAAVPLPLPPPSSTHCALPPACLSPQTNSTLRSLNILLHLSHYTVAVCLLLLAVYLLCPFRPCLLAFAVSVLACLASPLLYFWLCSVASERLSRSPSAFLLVCIQIFALFDSLHPLESCVENVMCCCVKESAGRRDKRRRQAVGSERQRALLGPLLHDGDPIPNRQQRDDQSRIIPQLLVERMRRTSHAIVLCCIASDSSFPQRVV